MKIKDKETDKNATIRICKALDDVFVENKCNLAETIAFCEILKLNALKQIYKVKEWLNGFDIAYDQGRGWAIGLPRG